MEPEIKIQNFTYVLPEEKIAKYPLASRDDSRILIFKNNLISESKFSNLTDYIEGNSLMVFNNTRVVPARLFFKRKSGAHIEVFCIEPHSPSDYARSFESTEKCLWNCVVGNSKRWKDDVIFFDSDSHSELSKHRLTARRVSNNGETSIIEFSWSGGLSFAQIMEFCGKVPIPPYLNRESEDADKERYQTLYAKFRGSVAAPTAGLHFTDSVLKALDNKGIIREELSLHVGTGTFKPVKTELIKDHPMHSEPFSVTLQFLKKLRDSIGKRCIVSVGTTSSRTLESLYYIGVRCMEGEKPGDVEQWEPYRRSFTESAFESINAICKWMESENRTILEGRTRIIIVPGYEFKLVDSLVTNFHQPSSTLLLLIAAFIGDNWREVYDYALNNNFRFLSYGDSSLLYRK